MFTEKVDGTNIRVIWDGWGLSFKGKTDRAEIPPFLLKALTTIFEPIGFGRVFDEPPVCLYGEGYGAKIHGGGLYRADQGFVLFDVKVGDWWLDRSNVLDVAEKTGLDIVPVVGRGTLSRMVSMVQKGLTSRWGRFVAEGIVARPRVELKTRAGQRIITKIKYRDFLRA